MMRKVPCSHYGTPETPILSPNPPNKQVLCNACGSDWRYNKTQLNYTLNDGASSSNGSDQLQDHIPPFLKRRSSLQQPPSRSQSPPSRDVTPIEEFQYELYCLAKQPEFAKLHDEREEDILIYPKVMTREPYEIGLGVVRYQPPTNPNK